MRYRLSAEVVGSALIHQNLIVDAGDIRFEFITDHGRRLSQVAASISVPPGTIRSYFEPGESTSWRAGIEGANDTHQRVLRALRSLESHIAFSAQGTIASFSWDKLETELIPDSSEELAPIRKLGIQSRYPEFEAGLGDKLLRMVAIATDSHKQTEAVKAFWREAQNEFRRQHYIQAYYNFYFVLEGLYAEGKASEKGVVNAFAGSETLYRSAEFMLEQLRADQYHLKNLSRFFEEEIIIMDVPGTLKLIVRLRGRLHHYSGRSSKLQPTPFNQAHFESPAWFMMGLTTHVILIEDIAIGPLMVAKPLAKRA